MYGQIFAKQKCPECGEKLTNDENRRGCFCPKHPKQFATIGFIVRFGRSTTKYCSTYEDAYRLLTKLRCSVDENTFDPRDYKSDHPLGFETLARQYIKVKTEDLKKGSSLNIRNYMEKAIAAWGNRNIKEITYADIDDFLRSLKNTSRRTKDKEECSKKTIANYRSCYNDFFEWVARRDRRQGGVQQFIPPELPEIKFKLGTREIISKSEQWQIIDRVKENTFHINPKIWLGIRMLAIYVRMRPVEMMRVKEKHASINGFMFIPPEDTKEGTPKPIPLLPEDIAFIQSLPKGDPEQFFFRWDSYYSGAKAGEKFGIGLLRRHWHIARKQLGIRPVDLYGGTRHSTVSDLPQQGYTMDEIKEYATGHTTNKAFDRYMCVDAKLSLDLYKLAAQRPSPPEVEPVEQKKETNILQFRRR